MNHKEKIIKTIQSNKGHNLLVEIRDAYIEVLKYHIRRELGQEFSFNTKDCAEADVILIKLIAKLLAKINNISDKTSYIGRGIYVKYNVDLPREGNFVVAGTAYGNTMDLTEDIKIAYAFSKSKEVYTVLLHEIIHHVQFRMNEYVRESSDVPYEERRREVEAYTISERVIDLF